MLHLIYILPESIDGPVRIEHSTCSEPTTQCTHRACETTLMVRGYVHDTDC